MSSRPLTRANLIYAENAHPCQRQIRDFAHCNHKYLQPHCGHKFCESKPQVYYVPGMIDDSQRQWQDANFYRVVEDKKCKDCELREHHGIFNAKRSIYVKMLDSGKSLLDPDVVEAGEVWSRAGKVLQTALESIEKRYEEVEGWEWVRTYYGQSLPANQTPSPERLAEPGVFMPRW